MADGDYYRDATDRIIQLMKDTFGTYFENRYFKGMPTEMLPEAAFPCCIVHKVSGSVELGATGQDVMRSQIRIHFLLNQSDDVNESGDVDTTIQKLQRMIEGRDAATGEWRKGTAMHALRTNITLDNTNIELAADIQYDVTVIDDMNNISEAIIEVITRETISVPARI